MGMPRKTLRKRRTCGRWRMVDGLRRCCPYPKGHEQECEPVRRLREAARREELTTLLAEHDDAECDPCAAAARYADAAQQGGEWDPGAALAMRCPWAQGMVRSLHALRGLRLPEPRDTAVQP